MNDRIAGSASPEEVAQDTRVDFGVRGDAADQAERLTMIMQAEAQRNGLHGSSGEGSLDTLSYPLEDVEATLAMEDAADGSDDPMHAGGLTPETWVGAEVAAMHVVDLADASDDAYVDDESDGQRADPYFDQFAATPQDLTPEDETLLGMDPYED